MLLQTLAEYGAHQALTPLSPEVAHHAKRALLDWFAALYPGLRSDVARVLYAAHADEAGTGRARVPGMGAATTPATAAWINGSVSHAVEFDDIFRDAVYHPGCPVIATALALADQRGSSGTALLRAIVAGYEVSTRIGAAMQPAHYRYFHTTGTVGSLGAAAAAAALLAPGNAGVFGHALATAASFAAGLQQAFRSDAMTKAMHAGNAANAGLRSALAAAHGATGVPDILEGEAGFGAALAGEVDWSLATRELGSDYDITRITQKNHGCCGHTFAAIDAAQALARQHGFTASEIESIEVSTYRTALAVTGNAEPRTAFEARFSLPYVVSHALVHGSVRLSAFEPERLQDPAVRALMRRLHLREDAQLSSRFPRQRGARVAIRLRDGRDYELLAPHRRGDPEAPLSDAEIEDKFAELAGPILGQAGAQALRQAVWSLDTLDVRDLPLEPAGAATLPTGSGNAAMPGGRAGAPERHA